MATRPYYRPLEKTVGCKTVESWQFEWHGGFAVSQKQKNVVALHEAIHLAEPEAKILEISSKSLQPLGVSLSAFNLKFQHGDAMCSVESVFQASKVFDGGIGPFPELYSHDSREVRNSSWKTLVMYARSGPFIGLSRKVPPSRMTKTTGGNHDVTPVIEGDKSLAPCL